MEVLNEDKIKIKSFWQMSILPKCQLFMKLFLKSGDQAFLII